MKSLVRLGEIGASDYAPPAAPVMDPQHSCCTGSERIDRPVFTELPRLRIGWQILGITAVCWAVIVGVVWVVVRVT